MKREDFNKPFSYHPYDSLKKDPAKYRGAYRVETHHVYIALQWEKYCNAKCTCVRYNQAGQLTDASAGANNDTSPASLTITPE